MDRVDVWQIVYNFPEKICPISASWNVVRIFSEQVDQDSALGESSDSFTRFVVQI